MPTGDAAIDAVRQAAAAAPTDERNHEQRYLTLGTFRHFLQRQGADTIACGPVHDRQRDATRSGDRGQFFASLDEEFRMLDGLYEELTENPPVSVPSGERRPATGPAPRDWPVYGGNPQHTAATEDRGPVEGTLAWRRPMALAWYPRPVIEDGRVYAASPGMRTILHCVDADSGELIWATPKRPNDDQGELTMVATHRTHCAASTPVVLGDTIVVNEIGGQHVEFAARNLLFIRKSDGRLMRKAGAGTLDYRVGHSIVTGDEKVLVYPAGTQRIQEVPPHIVGTSRITCVDTASGEELWDFYIGPTHGEPVLDGDRVYAGTADGMFFCLNVDIDTPPGRVWGVTPRKRVAWQFKVGGAANSTAVVQDDRILFGANDGCVYCLDKNSGQALWKHQVEPAESRAFIFFSTPRVADGRVYVGAANKHLYCLDLATGERLWEHRAEEWIRARPVCAGGRVYFATMDGALHCLAVADGTVEAVWQTRIGTHPIFSDPVLGWTDDVESAGGKIYVNSSDLFLWCIDAETGEIRWRHSLLSCVYRGAQRIVTDEVAAVAGGHFQSKPTAADGKLFVGVPGRFVYGLDYRTGDELWRFELGAAVSSAPAYSNGRVFFGQQGGEEYFYCVDANDGSLIWKQALSWVWSSANVYAGKLYVPGVDGYVYCLREEDGAILWRYRTGMAAHPEPPVDGGMVYFGSWDHYDYALNADDGSLVWQFYTGGTPDSGAPIAHGGRLYLPMGGDSFRCMDMATGEVIWEHRIAAVGYNASPALHDGRVFVSTALRTGGFPEATRIYCLDAVTGEEIWTHPGGGLTAPAVADGKVYFPSTADPFFYCVDEKGNGDGTTKTIWKYKMGDRVYESVPPIYGGMTYICCRDGWLYALQ